MSEWSKFGEVPTQAGRYVLEDKRGHWWLADWRNGPIPKEGYFAGNRHVLIPEPLKEPPKIRRFTAKSDGEIVSGIFLEGDNMVRTFVFTKEGYPTSKHCFISLEKLSDIEWLDKEFTP